MYQSSNDNVRNIDSDEHTIPVKVTFSNPDCDNYPKYPNLTKSTKHIASSVHNLELGQLMDEEEVWQLVRTRTAQNTETTQSLLDMEWM